MNINTLGQKRMDPPRLVLVGWRVFSLVALIAICTRAACDNTTAARYPTPQELRDAAIVLALLPHRRYFLP